MSAPDPHVRTDLGAYVLGALEPVERHQVEQHLEGCATCRDELSRLSVMPTLLDNLSAAEATADLDRLRRTLSDTADRAARDREQRLARQVRRWRRATAVSAAAAVLIGVVAWTPWRSSPEAIVVPLSPVAQRAEDVRGTASAYAWEWGTTVEIEVQELPEAEAYALWAVGADGTRERAGTWGPTGHHGAQVRGASAIQRDQLARVEVTTPDGDPLFDATFTRR